MIVRVQTRVIVSSAITTVWTGLRLQLFLNWSDIGRFQSRCEIPSSFWQKTKKNKQHQNRSAVVVNILWVILKSLNLCYFTNYSMKPLVVCLLFFTVLPFWRRRLKIRGNSRHTLTMFPPLRYFPRGKKIDIYINIIIYYIDICFKRIKYYSELCNFKFLNYKT